MKMSRISWSNRNAKKKVLPLATAAQLHWTIDSNKINWLLWCVCFYDSWFRIMFPLRHSNASDVRIYFPLRKYVYVAPPSINFFIFLMWLWILLAIKSFEFGKSLIWRSTNEVPCHLIKCAFVRLSFCHFLCFIVSSAFVHFIEFAMMMLAQSVAQN